MLSKQELNTFHKALHGAQYDRLPIIFNALGDPVRCKIARLLIQTEQDPERRLLSVGDIADVVRISQSSASQHLKILEITGVAFKEKQGRHRYYRLNQTDPIVNALVQAVIK